MGATRCNGLANIGFHYRKVGIVETTERVQSRVIRFREYHFAHPSTACRGAGCAEVAKGSCGGSRACRCKCGVRGASGGSTRAAAVMVDAPASGTWGSVGVAKGGMAILQSQM